jgi:hypothetical protein
MAEKKVINLDVETNLGSLRSQLRQAQADVAAMAEKFGATSTEAANAAKKAAELRDKIGDAKALTDAFNPDAKFNALTGSIGGVLNAFQAYEGALGVIGVDSKDLEATLLKVQAAMALSQGIQGAMEAKDAFVALGSVVKNAFISMTAAGRAFALTGIGLVVTAVGGLIYAYQNVSKEQENINKQQDDLNKAFEKQQDAIYKESTAFIGLIEQLKATNSKSEDRKRLIKEINATYGTTLKNLKDEKDFQNQLNTELKNYLTYQEYKYRLQANEDAIANNLKLQSKLRRDLSTDEAAYNKLIEQGALKRKETYETDELGIRVYTGLGYANEELAGKAQKLQQRIAENNQKLIDAKERFDNYGKAALYASNQIDKLTDGGKKYLKNLEDTADKTDEKPLFAPVDILQPNELKVLADENIQTLEKYTKSAGSLSDQLADKMAENAAKSVALTREEQQKKLQLTLDALNVLTSAVTLFDSKNERQARRNFVITKALNLATAITNTALAVTSALATTKEIFPGQRFVEAGVAGAAGAVQIAKISQTQFNAGGGGAGGNLSPNAPSGASSGVNAPNLSFSMQGGGSSTAQLLNSVLGQPLKAYVVSSDITSAQMLDAKAIKTSVL